MESTQNRLLIKTDLVSEIGVPRGGFGTTPKTSHKNKEGTKRKDVWVGVKRTTSLFYIISVPLAGHTNL